ncbi:MAG TPA: hypothetical protein VJ233_05060 [Hyphomicrobiaceae bacterium]|nr:hypothetical protein [Hyphomicrobiaceae bacterium]
MSEPDRNVFINCPFDKEFLPCFAALVFTITACGYVARCALEDRDGAKIRFSKLVKLISECRYTIHDLSRVELNINDLPRFNMPFELGLVIGAKHFGTKTQRQKSALIMVRQQFALSEYLSDLGGNDPAAHGDDPRELVRIVSRYLHRTPDGAPLPGGPQWLFDKFTLFTTEGLPRSAAAVNRTLAECDPIDDFLIYRSFVIEFLAQLKQIGG